MNRVIDMGADVHVVERSAEGEPGAFFYADAWVKKTGECVRRVGGMYDTVLRRFVAPSESPAQWFIGDSQRDPIIFDDDGERARFVCIGSAGSGKSEVGTKWALKRCIESGTNGGFGFVAPTKARLKVVWEKTIAHLRPSWIAQVKLGDMEIHLVNGCRIDFVSAKSYSNAFGTPLQGYTWPTGMLIDEEQDVSDRSMADAMMRGRNSKGRAYVLSTCTLKRNPEWLDRRRRYEKQAGTTVHTMKIAESPFISADYLKDLRERLPEAEYKMLVEAEEAPPERAVYPQFRQDKHLRPLPTGRRDVTRAITGHDVLIGHDPGLIKDVSIILKAFETDYSPVPWWFVIGEVTSVTTTEEHGYELLDLLNKRGIRQADCLVRVDPHGDTNAKPHVSIYKTLQLIGFHTKAAVYNSKGKPGFVPKDGRIQMVNQLLKNAKGETRLFIEELDGHNVAPALTNALMLSERDLFGRAEMQRKDNDDLSHWPAALGYALWHYEKPKVHTGVTPIRAALGGM